jgi:hypothetical protein
MSIFLGKSGGATLLFQNPEPIKSSLGPVNPERCYVKEYRKTRIGRLIKATKVKVELVFVVEDVQHVFEVYHSMTGSYKIYMDGVFVLKFTNYFDGGMVYKHKDPVEGRMVTLTILDKDNAYSAVNLSGGYSYNVTFDGVDGKMLGVKNDVKMFYKEDTSIYS